MSKTYITSDEHFGHAKIALYSGRPYVDRKDIVKDEETGRENFRSRLVADKCKRAMNEDIIKKHNEIVGQDDETYHCGDFIFGTTSEAIEILRRLNGRHHFIWGNHDRTMKDLRSILHFYDDLSKRVTFLGHYAEISREGESFLLFHYPMLVWDRMHYGSYALCGHSHGTCAQSNPKTTTSRLLDVGVDSHDFKPWSIEEILKHLDGKKIPKFDHHEAK